MGCSILPANRILPPSTVLLPALLHQDCAVLEREIFPLGLAWGCLETFEGRFTWLHRMTAALKTGAVRAAVCHSLLHHCP